MTASSRSCTPPTPQKCCPRSPPRTRLRTRCRTALSPQESTSSGTPATANRPARHSPTARHRSDWRLYQ